MSVFFDSNVLLYTLDAGAYRQEQAITALRQGGTISVQVLNEVVNAARRKFKLSWSETAKAVTAMRAFCRGPVPLTLQIHERAVELAMHHSFSIYDALIVASALEAKCDVLLSEDMQDGRLIDGRLRIQNPFRQV